jgi:hypothetical protein
MTARPDEHRHQIGQLATRELDLYGSQLARCLKALGTDAPIRADVQRELATVRAEQDSRARAAEPRDPATAARHADARDRQTGHLRAELARIGTAERALISELETPADPADPAAQAYRARIRARYAEPHDERTKTEAKLAVLESAAAPDNDPALLDALPIAAHVLADAPSQIKQPSWPRSTSTPSTTTT